jgi:hypothetical protein
MDRIKLIRKLAIPIAIVFIVSIIVLVSNIPFRSLQHDKRMEKLNTHIANLTQQYQKYLTETAVKISSVPVDQKIISDTQSKILQDNQQIKWYLWMNDNSGNFVFGSPVATFTKLNNAYDKYEENIINDGHFMNRNEYLGKLIDRNSEVNFSEFESRSIFKSQHYDWRFYRGRINENYYVQPYRFILSAPVTGENEEVIGELYLKIDDSHNKNLYYSRRRAENYDIFATMIHPIFGVITFFSGLFLWFLLPTWVYIDAQQRDVRSPGLWAFLTVISLFFGLTIYLITRPSTYKSFHCPQCENELNGTKAFCPHCGFDLSSTFCPQCQYPIQQNWQFCPNCRAGLGEKQEVKEVAEEKNDS